MDDTDHKMNKIPNFLVQWALVLTNESKFPTNREAFAKTAIFEHIKGLFLVYENLDRN